MALRFPQLYSAGCPMALFTPFKYRFPHAGEPSAVVTLDPGSTGIESCALYIPATFAENSSATWAFQQVFGGDAQGLGNNAGQELMGAIKAGAGEKLSGTYSAVNGVTVAPMDIMVYAGAGEQDLNFQFQMLAVSQAENETILKIAQNFKMAMKPKREKADSWTLLYPAIWKINFEGIRGMGYNKNGKNGTGEYDWMALTKCDITYSGDTGISVYTDQLPIQTNMNLSFKCIKKVWD